MTHDFESALERVKTHAIDNEIKRAIIAALLIAQKVMGEPPLSALYPEGEYTVNDDGTLNRGFSIKHFDMCRAGDYAGIFKSVRDGILKDAGGDG